METVIEVHEPNAARRRSYGLGPVAVPPSKDRFIGAKVMGACVDLLRESVRGAVHDDPALA
jgi:hypothetical protein